jgi:predicted TIM-barrel fold metal-dependent hydrolase
MTTRREFLAAAGALAGSGQVGQARGRGQGPHAAQGAAPRKVPVIDCHVHAGHAPALTDPWTTIADPVEILRRMDEAGVDQACIFPISNDPDYARANQEIAAICRQYPARFIGFAKHNPITEKGRIRRMMLHECRDLGLRGLKLHVHPGREVLDVCAELGIPILYHPARVALFEEVAPAYPAVDLILAHLGSDMSMDYREHLAAIALARKYPNVYLDTSTVVITRYLEKAIAELPAEKIVYGTDEPEVDTRLEIFKIRVLKLPKEKEEAILGGNMERLLSKYRGGRA